MNKHDLIKINKELYSALLDARGIIYQDLGVEIESVENALANSTQYKDDQNE